LRGGYPAVMVERNGETPMNRRLEFRVGIHEGDIVVDEQDIFGDGVNVAARLQALSEPGGICISSRVYEDLAGRLELPFEDQGEQQLKNIARSVRIFCLGKKALAELRTTPSLEDGPNEPTGALQRHQRGPLAWLPTRWMPWRPATPPWTAAFNTRSAKLGALITLLLFIAGASSIWYLHLSGPLASGPRLSIVVLPFTNLGNEPGQEYFADGITEDLTADLARIAGSFVIAPSTAPRLQERGP
jgi:adenylate cyclase